MSIKDLEPKVVWGNFYGLTQVPRPSKHEEKVIEYLLNWGKEHGVEVFKDETGNVIFRAPATPGYENRRGVILQGHMDMVPQKTSDSTHNFLTDPIQAYVDGEWVTADRTTLGADNGMGVAMGLAVCEDKSVEHGPVEVACGLISKRRSFNTSTLTIPTVLVVACNCRLTLVIHTRSLSTMVRWLMPLRTRLSAHQLPTPPTPKMMTRLFMTRSIVSSPKSRFKRLNMGFCALIMDY